MKNILVIQHTQSIHHTNGMVGAGITLHLFFSMWIGLKFDKLISLGINKNKIMECQLM